MARVLVIEARERLAQLLVERLRARLFVDACHRAPGPAGGGPGAAAEDGLGDLASRDGIDTVVYAPPCPGRAALPDLAAAERLFRSCAAAGVGRVVLLSSAAVYGPTYHNRGLLAEAPPTGRQRGNRIAAAWRELEALAERCLGERPETRLIVLRLAAVPLPEDAGPLGGLFRRRVAVTLPGHDPSVQLLSPDDLADAVCCAVRAERAGVYNIAPAGVMPLRQALRLAGRWRLPVPYLLQRAARAVLARLGLAGPADRVEYLRYSWTVSGARAAAELGFAPRRSSAEAVADCLFPPPAAPPPRRRALLARRFDDHGLDERYFAALGRTLVPFLDRCYWRVEARGLERVPREGPAVLVGVHRGFMPFDGVIAAHQVVRETGRLPRFLIHPGLIKFPFLHDFMIKQGGMIACNENADAVLGRGGLLAIYPEGIHGAFRLYRDAYRLGRFGRDEYVRMALRNRAPLVPFVTVGSAETFPILGKLEWSWWKRYAEWPFIPLTPTFPVLPVPLPSKWHTEYLEPLHVERDCPPQAADDEATVRAISAEVRRRMGESLAWMVGRRRSIFFGSVFPKEPAAAAGAVRAEGDVVGGVYGG